ncbi:MAG: hypothetical protein ACRDJ9_30480, partial [Dehalococcoidia bacterium]
KLCAQRLARLYGFAPGERMDELMDASSRVEQAARELGERDRRLRTMDTQAADQARRISELEAELEQAEGRAEQLRATLEEKVEGMQAQLEATDAVA